MSVIDSGAPTEKSAPGPERRRRAAGAARFLALALGGLLALQAIFFVGLVAAQAVPNAPIIASLATAVGDGTYGPAYVPDGVGGSADRFTECVIVGYGVSSPQDPRSVLARAAGGPRLESCELGAQQITQLAAGERVDPPATYFRYWNGYSVLTRPVLAIVGLEGLRLVVAGLLLSAGLAAFLAVRRGAGTAAALAVVLPLAVASNAITTPSTASSHGIALAAILAGVALTAAAARRGWRGAVVGAAGAGALLNYVDLLTTPAMSWALCAAVAGAVVAARGVHAARVAAVTAAAGAAWAVAYGVTWVSRWCIAALARGPEVFAQVREVGAFRLEGENPMVIATFGAATRANLREWLWNIPTAWWVLLVVALVALGGIGVGVLRRGPGALALFAAVAAPAAVVPVWYEVMSNHSQIHAFFTYASLPAAAGVLALAGIAASTPRRWQPGVTVRAFDTRRADQGPAARSGHRSAERDRRSHAAH